MTRRAAVPALVAVLVVLASVQAACSGRGPARAGSRRRIDETPRWSHPLFPPADALEGDDQDVVAVRGNAVTDLDLADGHERWSSPVDDLGVEAPALDGTSVLVSASHAFVALARADGARRWAVPTPEEAGPVALAVRPDGPAVALLGTWQGTLMGVDAPTGVPRWSIAERGAVRSPPAVDGASGTAAVVWHRRGGSVLRRVDVASGRILWERGVPALASAPVLSHGSVVIGVGVGADHGDAAVVALRFADGTERWIGPVPAAFEPDQAPTVDGDLVVVADRSGSVSAFDLSTGARRWERVRDDPVLAGRPAIGRRTIVLTSEDTVVTLERSTGRVLAERRSGAIPLAGSVGAGRVVVGFRGGASPAVEARRLR